MVTLEIKILRRESRDAAPFWQSFFYTPQGDGETVATVLTWLCETPDLRDIDGNPAALIRWEHSCLQKKCGACAMVINGTPRLACHARLSEYKDVISLEPLRKFPVAADLIVDRSAMLDQLRSMALWLREDQVPIMDRFEDAYDSSRCLQCGLCLEVCPNFRVDGAFFGASAAIPAGRLLSESDNPRKTELAKAYRQYVYEGCGRSLACHDVCPAGIDVERLMAKSNGAVLWRLFQRKKKGD